MPSLPGGAGGAHGGAAGATSMTGGMTPGGTATGEPAAGAGGEIGIAGPPIFRVAPGEGGRSARSIAAGDLNDDGRTDLVIARDDGYLGVRLGIGDGTFASEVPYWVDAKLVLAFRVAIGDMDSDGKPDLVASIGTSEEDVRVLFNAGDGTFQQTLKLSSRADTERVPAWGAFAIADLNADRLPDLAIGGGAVLLNKGNREFAPAESYGAKSSNGVAAADLDGDGAPELVHSAGAAVRVLINQIDGSFASSTSYPTRSEVRSLAVADLNADGRPDVVAALGAANEVAVFLTEERGKLAPAIYYPAAPLPWAIAVGDLNGDDRPDLALASFDPSIPFSVMVNEGEGVFSAPLTFPEAPGRGLRTSVVVADLDGDGKRDLAVVGEGDAEETVFLNTTPF